MLPYGEGLTTGFANPVSDLELQRMVMKHRRRMVNTMLEFLILNYLRKGSLCGYDIIKLLHDKFRVLLSPGQVYPVIDSMTEMGLIHKEQKGRMTLLRLSGQGEELAKAWRSELDLIQLQLDSIASETLPVF